MADFRLTLTNVVNEFNISNIEYLGIQRKFFPKWEGWALIDNNQVPSYQMVYDFYNIFFWSKLKGDLIDNQDLAELLFMFSITNGKRKTIDKLDRVFGADSNGTMNNLLITKLNGANINFIFMFIYAELCEFCIMLDKKRDFCKLLKIYNSFVNSISA